MTITNRKGQTAGAEQVPAPAKKRGRPKKTEIVTNKVYPALPTGAFHQMFPFMLKYTDEKVTRTCYFQCEEHLDKHIMRHKLDKRKLTIGQTEPRTY